MGQRTTQTIHTCAICEKTPDDGEFMWHMPSGVWCEECCDRVENEPDQETVEERK